MKAELNTENKKADFKIQLEDFVFVHGYKSFVENHRLRYGASLNVRDEMTNWFIKQELKRKKDCESI